MVHRPDSRERALGHLARRGRHPDARGDCALGPLLRQALSNLPPGVHLLTAWVGDADFNEPVGGEVTVTGAGGTDSFTWVLDVELCP